jgi:hypothetical protein
MAMAGSPPKVVGLNVRDLVLEVEQKLLMGSSANITILIKPRFEPLVRNKGAGQDCLIAPLLRVR